MEQYNKVNDVLINTTPVKNEKIVNRSFQVEGLTIERIRDILMQLGKIKREILQENIYVTVINGGVLKKNRAIVVLQLSGDEIYIAAYADEGIINQHTSEGVINEIGEHIKQYIRR
jgi:hypothetical protein